MRENLLWLGPAATIKSHVKSEACVGLDLHLGNGDPVRVSHASVLDVLPVHQHVLPAQHPHLALTRQHVALKLLAAVSVNLRGRKAVDAVLREAGHRLSERKDTAAERDLFTRCHEMSRDVQKTDRDRTSFFPSYQSRNIS